MAVGFLLVLPACASIEAALAPAKEPWPRWTVHDERSELQVDHSAYDRLLKRYLAEDAGLNRFAYARVTPADRKALQQYIAALSATDVSRLNRSEQRAYWINLYNALTIETVLAHYPVASILDIDLSRGLLSRGPWDRALINVDGQPLTLNDIEHRILRPVWNDPRLHYAVNCASVGCPNLQSRAFTAADAERMLDQAAKAYVNHPRGVRVDGGKAVASKIYLWFQKDFGGSEPAVIAHLRQYADPSLSTALSTVRIARYEYDWSLNAATP